MNNNNSMYENETFTSKLKGYFLLILYILSAALVTIVAIDILVFPITIFAVKKTTLFTSTVKALIKYGFLSYIILSITVNLIKNKKNGFNNREIVQVMILDPLKKVSMFLILLILTSAIIISLFNILSKNHMLLNSISG